MTILEINIGLDVTNGYNSPVCRDERAKFALAVLPTMGEVLGARRAESATEETLVVRLRTEALQATFEALFDLCVPLQQDCIAIYNTSAMSGALVGPNAASWGEFNPEFFIRFDETAGPAQIYTPRARGTAVDYTGHGAKTGGLQAHSVGDEYPYIIIGVADRWEAPTRYAVMDSRTGNLSESYPTYMRAYIETMSLKVRNMVHS